MFKFISLLFLNSHSRAISYEKKLPRPALSASHPCICSETTGKYQIQETEELLQKLQQWCEKQKTKLEVEINDWAMADMLKGALPDLVPCFGRMLNKRKKDPRMPYKKGNVELLQENNLTRNI